MHGYKIIGMFPNDAILHFFVPNWELVVEFVGALADGTGASKASPPDLNRLRQHLSRSTGLAYLFKDDQNSFLIQDVSRITASETAANPFVPLPWQKQFMHKLKREQLAWKAAKTLDRNQDFYKDWSVSDLQQRLDAYFQIENRPGFMKPTVSKKDFAPKTKTSASCPEAHAPKTRPACAESPQHAVSPVKKTPVVQTAGQAESDESSSSDEDNTLKPVSKEAESDESSSSSSEEELHPKQSSEKDDVANEADSSASSGSDEESDNELTNKLVVQAVIETRKKDLASLIAIKKWLRERGFDKGVGDFDKLVLNQTKSCVSTGLLTQTRNSFSIRK
jgi:hypothetical protein